ncbi:MAG: OB-fold domain-containing protein [Novosphingobium sp.]|jgi:uncharacterized OB-fold protein|nr:OB-fold domain-containing protein [Novosphingobium sp.]
MRIISEGLITDETPPRLLGGRHKDSGRIVFPCPAGEDFDAYPLQRHGHLWSYTVQRYRPKSPPYTGPEAFEPWAVAYVELPGETIVEARLANIALDEIRIGMPLRLTLIPLDPSASDPIMIHAFEPAGEPA